MRTEVTADLLVAVAKDVGFPPTRLGTLHISDEGAWRHCIARATRAERVSLLVALGPELLVATEGGRRRVAAQTETRIADQQRWPGTRDVDGEPAFYGDRELLGTVKAALALVPPVVRYAVQAEVAFLAVGRSSIAWTGSASFVDVTGLRKGRVIVLGPEVDVPGVLHEVAHAWCSGPPSADSILITKQGEEGLRALAVAEGWIDRIDAHVRRDECLADALALGWLFSQPEGSRPA